MTPQFLSLVTIVCSFHPISSIRRPSDNGSPLGAYLIAVRRPDGLHGVDEPDALERWHTHLLEQVCNTSDPATSGRFPTAESRLIYSYSHVVSGFSAWLTPRELEGMAMYPWFVEAVPDKSYKLMSVETPTPQLSGDGEGLIIGLLDAGGVPSIPEAEGMPPPPAKWKGRCDRSEACNNNLIGLRSFVDTNRSQGTASGSSFHRAPAAGVVDYATAFAVAPKAHLAIYRVCDELGCDPKAVAAGMDAAVDNGVGVVTLLISNDEDNTVFRDEDAVSVLSYEAVARGVLVCAPAGSDTDHRAVTNVELGNGILKPDVSAPGLMSTTTESLPHGGVEGSDANLKAAASVAAAHVSGVAAMIKKAHPEWSPPVIKSALPVRTADALTGDHAASYFVVGAGGVDPAKAMHPGLVYDLAATDFIPHLCGMGLGDGGILRTVEPKNASCAESGVGAAKDLNYPSVMIFMDDDVRQVEAKRTVTNVGEPAEKYIVEATAPGVDVVVTPSTLAFNDFGQKMDFVVTVKRAAITPAKAVIEGELKWVSEKHAARRPLVIVVGETAASSVSYSNVHAASSDS